MPPRGILPRTGGGAREQTLGLNGYLDNVIQSDQAIGDCHARYSLAFRCTSCRRDRSDGHAHYLKLTAQLSAANSDVGTAT